MQAKQSKEQNGPRARATIARFLSGRVNKNRPFIKDLENDFLDAAIDFFGPDCKASHEYYSYESDDPEAAFHKANKKFFLGNNPAPYSLNESDELDLKNQVSLSGKNRLEIIQETKNQIFIIRETARFKESKILKEKFDELKSSKYQGIISIGGNTIKIKDYQDTVTCKFEENRNELKALVNIQNNNSKEFSSNIFEIKSAKKILDRANLFSENTKNHYNKKELVLKEVENQSKDLAKSNKELRALDKLLGINIFSGNKATLTTGDRFILINHAIELLNEKDSRIQAFRNLKENKLYTEDNFKDVAEFLLQHYQGEDESALKKQIEIHTREAVNLKNNHAENIYKIVGEANKEKNRRLPKPDNKIQMLTK